MFPWFTGNAEVSVSTCLVHIFDTCANSGFLLLLLLLGFFEGVVLASPLISHSKSVLPEFTGNAEISVSVLYTFWALVLTVAFVVVIWQVL